MASIPMAELGSTAEPVPTENETSEVATTSFTEAVEGAGDTVNTVNGDEDLTEEYVDEDDFDDDGNAVVKQRRIKAQAVDLQGYVIIVVTTKDKKIKLYGSPSSPGRDSLEVADEILDVNETHLEDMTREEVIAHIHECIQSCLIKLRVKRQSEEDLAVNISNIVEDAFLIAVEQQARERLQRLSALKKIQPVDMSKLSIELNKSGKEETVQKENQSAKFNGNHKKNHNVATGENLKENHIGYKDNHNSGIKEKVKETPKSGVKEKVKENHKGNHTSKKSFTVNLREKFKENLKSNVKQKGKENQKQNHNEDLKEKLKEKLLKRPPNGIIVNSALFTTKIHGEDPVETKPIAVPPKLKPESQQTTPSPVIENGIGSDSELVTTKAVIESDRNDRDTPNHEIEIVEAIIESNCKDVETEDDAELDDDVIETPEPLTNGNVEKLIGELPDNKAKGTTAIENNRESSAKGSRRRSGSSIVVLSVDDDKRPPGDDDQDIITMLSVTSDTGPHREMAVDVPDSFIARNKTPPRYPPPRPPQVRQRSPRDEEPLLSSSGGSSTSFGSKQSTLLRSAATHLSGPVSDTSGSYKTQETNTLELMSEPQSSEGSRTSFGSKKSSKGSSETAKCGDLFADWSPSAASSNTHTLNDHIIQLLVSNGDDIEGVSYSAKSDSVLIREAIYASYNLPAGFDTTPVLLGREVAVDVPDSFVQIVKTTPKYPCTVNRKSVPFYQGVNGSSKPAVPPREVPRDAPPRPPTLEPTKEQLESIKKYQEQLRQRKEAEDRAAAQNEFLRNSLRGSAKLQQLESRAVSTTAFDNGAFEEDDPESDTASNTANVLKCDVAELTAALVRLQKSLSANGEAGLASRVAGATSILLSPSLKSVVNTRMAVLTAVRRQLSPPCTLRAMDRLKDCIDVLGGHTTTRGESAAMSAELLSILGGLELESLIQAHDQAASLLDLSAFTKKEKNGSVVSEKVGITSTTICDDPNEIKIIKIDKTNEPLGATVKNEGEAVIIGRIVRGGAAEKSGVLHEGDELLEVNGIPMRSKSVHEVCQILGSLSGTLTLWIAPRPAPPRPPPANRVLHVRAHFDYDPEDDVYIPCRELGISFQKGDVLHVISRDDPNWWQAFREGEEDQSLAGLIPSQAFQHQRESMKLTLAGEVAARDKPRKGGTLLCAKKAPRKKKGKKATSEAGYPLYSTSGTDEYEQEEILTYEEVALYYPRASHKRPIVLIGPPNIGRHELRQRLMEDSARFAAAVPHTSRPRKDHEVPGQDYHFISRTQFEADILNRKFVEHGEYEKAYYGTSLEAIREVVISGKICVLNLHPQSLKILRTSDLKPYTVFVAPPSLEKLRQKKIRNGEAFKEEELKEIIATARDMELRWGHLFDMIIINNDTQRAYQQLLNEINSLEREPQWVPANWLKQT